MSDVVSPADVERLVWRLSGWQVDQRSLDVLLTSVQQYARWCAETGSVAEWVPAGPPPEDAAPEQAPQEAAQGGVEPSGQDAGAQEAPTPVAGAQTGAQDGAGMLAEGAYVLTVTRIARPERAADVPRADGVESVRTCRKCGVSYPITSFHRDKTSRGGRKTACIPCENMRRRDERRVQRAREAA